MMKKPEHYKAVIRKNEEQPRLFKNKFLEKLTYTTPTFIIVQYVILTVICISYYVLEVNPETSFVTVIKYYFFGLFSWTLGEYLLHRFLYHKIKDASYDSGLQYIFHGIHHEYPNDTKRIILPPLPSLMIAAILFGIIYMAFWLIQGSGDLAFIFSPGFINGYILYMLIHYTVHKVPSPKKYNFWWRHHNIHHFQQHDRAFGVSTPIWDIVFRTMPEKGRRTIVDK